MRNGTTRPSIERMVRIANLARSGRTFTASQLAKDFETNRRTIMRDIEFMRDRLGYEIVWSPDKNSYVTTAELPAPIL